MLVATDLPLAFNLVSQGSQLIPRALRATRLRPSTMPRRTEGGVPSGPPRLSAAWTRDRHRRLLFPPVQCRDGLRPGAKSSVGSDSSPRLPVRLRVSPSPRNCFPDTAAQVRWQRRDFLGQGPSATRAGLKAVTVSHPDCLPKLWLEPVARCPDGRGFTSAVTACEGHRGILKGK